ncbi:MAG: hypothetical protein JJT81_05105 [Rubellimicrobium sp.]|nr:hypothetical protein [Rubellimicrobium sp.]
MTRAAHLARMGQGGPLDAAPARIAILTGQARLDRSPLSPAQDAFLTGVAPKGWAVLRAGFPYDAEGAPEPPGPFASAARASIRQYLWARTSPAYARHAARALARLTAATTDRLVLITGSAGLAIFAAAEPHLPPPLPRLALVAFGPAGPRPLRAAPPPGAAALHAGRSRHDRWSALLGPPADRLIAGDHYGYWTSAEARALVASHLRGAA